MGEFRMPSLGADMEQGTIVEWRIAPGDTVHRGDIVAVIETEKSTIEVEVFEDGVVEDLVAAEGDVVAVGAVLATILIPGQSLTAAPAGPEAGATIEPADGDAKRTPEPVVRSPLIRHLAERLDVDLRTVPATGAHGTISRADVEQAAHAAHDEPVLAGSVSPSRPVTARTGSGDRRVRATPRARRLARDAGINLRDLAGSGRGHEIYSADVTRALGASATAEPTARPAAATAAPTVVTAATVDPRQKRRAAVAALMSRSKREIPHYYLSSTVDFATAARWLAEANQQRTVHDRLIPAALLLRATVMAATASPTMNGHWRNNTFHPSGPVHLGVAVSLRGGGLVAPTIQHADELDLEELMNRLRALVGRARAGVLRGSEMTEPTITVTNIGEQGIEQLFGVIYPPQVALVGFGAIVDRPWAVDGMLAVRPLVAVTLSADHRASDGHDGARFVATIDRLLQHPEGL